MGITKKLFLIILTLLFLLLPGCSSNSKISSSNTNSTKIVKKLPPFQVVAKELLTKLWNDKELYGQLKSIHGTINTNGMAADDPVLEQLNKKSGDAVNNKYFSYFDQETFQRENFLDEYLVSKSLFKQYWIDNGIKLMNPKDENVMQGKTIKDIKLNDITFQVLNGTPGGIRYEMTYAYNIGILFNDGSESNYMLTSNNSHTNGQLVRMISLNKINGKWQIDELYPIETEHVQMLPTVNMSNQNIDTD